MLWYDLRRPCVYTGRSGETVVIFSSGLEALFRRVWRPCNFTPIHSLTGLVGQLFASRQWGQRFPSRGCTHSHNRTGFLLLALPCYIGDPTWLITGLALGSVLTMRSFTRLCVDDVKASCDHTLPSPFPFPSLQVLLLLATQWRVRAPVTLLRGSPVEALQFHSNTQSHWSSGSTVCFPPKGSAVRILEMHPLSQWNRFLLLALSYYKSFQCPVVC